jgi:hypothetical protein
MLTPLWASAQTEVRAYLSVPQSDQFPIMTAYLDVRDNQGSFVPDLSVGELTIIEDGIALPVSVLQELRPGIQLVVAMSPSNPFAIRDGQGVSRYDYITRFLSTWADLQLEPGTDDLSLLTPSGNSVSHLAEPQELLDSLETYQPNFNSAQANLEVLSRAVDLAADPTPRPGMGKVVLFITPTVEPTVAEVLQNIADRAAQLGVRVIILLVDSPGLYDAPGGDVLQAFIQQTGGHIFYYDGPASLPDLEAYLEPLRKVYQLFYNSRITTPGSHQVSLQIEKDGWEAVTEEQSFDLELLPPNPVFVSPPSQILRSNLPDSSDQEVLLPAEQTFEVIVEFPDSFERELIRTTLYANGEIVDENNAPPFNVFTWDLSGFTTSERVTMVVEVVDELGLSGMSIETPIQITIQIQPQGLRPLLARYGTTIAIGIAALAGAGLLMVLVLSGRLRPRPTTSPQKSRSLYDDPVTQPVKQNEKTRPSFNPFAIFAKRIPAPRIQWRPQRRSTSEPIAYLSPLSEKGEPLPNGTIPITSKEVTFGSDPDLSSKVLDDPSLDEIHSRLWRDDEGVFHLADSNTIAGTWVNYAPVSTEGSRIEHGDLLHIGAVGFRFTMRAPTRIRRPVVIPMEYD